MAKKKAAAASAGVGKDQLIGGSGDTKSGSDLSGGTPPGSGKTKGTATGRSKKRK